jgi:predicted dehydrogenase
MPTFFDRREWLRTSLFAAAGVPAATACLRGESLPRAAAQERIGLGFIGVGGMGMGTLRGMLSQPDVEVRAVCDVYAPHAEQAKEATKGRADVCTDFRRVLDRKDIDAVVISTPDHWHMLCAIQAAQAGKHVYVEKPLSHTIAEGQAFLKAARAANIATQMGIQIHGGENYHKVVDLVRSGCLGTIKHVDVWVFRGPLGIGRPADGAPPPGLDWNFWQGPAPARPFNRNRFIFNWRWFWDYGGGMLADMGCHVIDLVHWAMQANAPTRIVAEGKPPTPTEDNSETPPLLQVTYDYPGFTMKWSTCTGPAPRAEKRGLGIRFIGDRGTLEADYGSHTLTDPAGQPLPAPTITSPIARSPGHHRDWLNAIKDGHRCAADVEYAHRLTSVCHLGNLAFRLNRPLTWDPQREAVVDDTEANVHLTKPYRAPWRLP